MRNAIDMTGSDSDVREPSTSDELTPRDLSLGRTPWQTFYTRGLLVTDLLVLAGTTVIAEFVRFGLGSGKTTSGPLALSYEGLGIVIALAWWASLTIFDSRDLRILGEGFEEYQRLARVTFMLFGGLAILSLIFKVDMSRGYLAIAFPLGLVLLLINRKLWRIWLRRGRMKGRNISQVLVVGGIRSALHMTRMFDGHAGSGLKVTGVWVPDRVATPGEKLDLPDRAVPVVGTARTLTNALKISGADTVVVTDTEHLGHDGLRELAWQLEGVDVDLMVSPNVMDISGSRIHMRAVASMPLLHLEEPQYAEAGSWPKTLFDKVVAGILCVLFSPIMLVVAIAVKVTSPGRIFYLQDRVGRGGMTFRVIKFRSMRADSDRHLGDLLAAQGAGDEPLFKVTDDPRITPVGRFIRRFSLDELPQLLNVLRGDMSLVGPRPQRQAEVELYDKIAHRRLTVRPGMTGLWQVSGRSDLSWEDAIRLDTSYVENWSMTGDLVILFKTARAVLGSSGAY